MFRHLLSPESRARIDREDAEATRIAGLPDRFMAEALLKLSRGVRAHEAFEYGAFDNVYDPVLLWHVVPEIAYRLGATRLQDGERCLPVIRKLSNEELLERLQICLKNINSHRYPDSLDAGVLFRGHVHGNPVLGVCAAEI